MVHAVVASVSGENISEIRSKSKLARRLGVSIKTISRGHRIRTKILKSSKSCWEYAQRKSRSDAITDKLKEVIYNFWTSSQVSRPTGNKKDAKRHRIDQKLTLVIVFKFWKRHKLRHILILKTNTKT